MKIRNRATRSKKELKKLLKPGYLEHLSLIHMVYKRVREGRESTKIVTGILGAVTKDSVYVLWGYETTIYNNDTELDTPQTLFSINVPKEDIIVLQSIDLTTESFTFKDNKGSRVKKMKMLVEENIKHIKQTKENGKIKST